MIELEVRPWAGPGSPRFDLQASVNDCAVAETGMTEEEAARQAIELVETAKELLRTRMGDALFDALDEALANNPLGDNA